jgi:hypothetical protein
MCSARTGVWWDICSRATRDTNSSESSGIDPTRTAYSSSPRSRRKRIVCSYRSLSRGAPRISFASFTCRTLRWARCASHHSSTQGDAILASHRARWRREPVDRNVRRPGSDMAAARLLRACHALDRAELRRPCHRLGARWNPARPWQRIRRCAPARTSPLGESRRPPITIAFMELRRSDSSFAAGPLTLAQDELLDLARGGFR